MKLFILCLLVILTVPQLSYAQRRFFVGGCSSSYCPPPAIVQRVVVAERPNTTPYVVPYVAPVHLSLDEAFLRLAEHQQTHQFFLEKLTALSLHRSYANNIYGTPSYSYGAIGSSGNTLYSSVQQTQQYYGQMPDIGSLYLQSQLLVNGAKDLHYAGIQGHQALVAQAGADQARILEILTRAEAAAKILRNLEMPKSTVTTTVNQASNIPLPGDNSAVISNSGVSPKSLIRQNLCGNCHGANRKEANFDIATYDLLSQSQKAYVISRLVTNDLTRRMPRNPDGSVGNPITQEQFEAFK